MSKIILTEPLRRYVRDVVWNRKHTALFCRTLRSGHDEIKLFQEPLYDLIAAHEHRKTSDVEDDTSQVVWNQAGNIDLDAYTSDPRSVYLSLSKEGLKLAHLDLGSGKAYFAVLLEESTTQYLLHTLLWNIELKAYQLAVSTEDDSGLRKNSYGTHASLTANLSRAVAAYELLTRWTFDPNLLDDWGHSDGTDGPKTSYKVDAVVVKLVKKHFYDILSDLATGRKDEYLCGQLGYCLKRAWEAVMKSPCPMTARRWIEYVRLGTLRWRETGWPTIFDNGNDRYMRSMLMAEPPAVENWEELSLSPVALEGFLWALNGIKPYLHDNEAQELRVFNTLSELWNEPAFLNTLPEHRSLGRIRNEILAETDSVEE